jgi:peptidoglycan/LPS O-acetylase OafA/YrhL
MNNKRSRLYVVVAAALFYALFIFRTSFVIGGKRYFVLFEDAMISMRYAKHFAEGHGFVWNVGEPPIEGFTNFLWTLWMSVGHLIGLSESKRSLFIMLTGFAILMALGFVTSRIARLLTDAPWVPLLVLAATLFDYPLVFWTLRGMEVGALTLCVYTLLYLALKNEEEFSVPRTVGMGALTAASLLLRSDSIVPVGLIGLYGLLTAKKRVLFVAIMGVFAGTALGGQLQFRKAHFHETLPNTYYLKLHGITTPTRVKRGLFVALEVLAMHLSVPIAFVVACLPKVDKSWLRDKTARRRILLLLLVSAQVGYATYVGGDAWEWMLYANRYLCVGMPALILLSASLFAEVLGNKGHDAASFAKRLSLGLAGCGALLLALNILGKLRPEQGIAATIVFSKTPTAVGAALVGAAILLRMADLRIGIAEGLDALRRTLASKRTASAAALVLAAVVWVPCHALPLGRWLVQNAAQYTDEARYTRLGLLIRASTPDTLRIAVAAAGATPYFCARPTEDLLGKNDRVIARMNPRGVFSPGHDKWDYSYSLGKREAQLIVETVDRNDDDDAYIKKLGFEQLPNELLLRADAKGVNREVLGTVTETGADVAAALEKAGATLPESLKPQDIGVVLAFGALIAILCRALLRDDDDMSQLAEAPEGPTETDERKALRAAAEAGAVAKQIPTLDGMRGIAVLSVLAFHFAWTFPDEGIAKRAHDFLWSGWAGVDLFFVLSGYLITRGLVSPSGRALGTRLRMFWMRRVLRIFPLYYAFIIVGTIVALALGMGWIPSWHYWLYMQNYTLAFDPLPLRWTAHFWSLAIEEQFYFVWPIVALMVPKRRLVPLILALVALCVLVRAGVTFKYHGDWTQYQTVKFVYRATFTRADGLLLGALVAVLQRETDHPLAHAWRRVRFPVLVASAVVLLGLYIKCHGLDDYNRIMVGVGYVTLAVFFASAVSLCADTRIGETARKLLSSRPLVACGKVSYGMYIFHWVLVVLLVPRLESMQKGMGMAQQVGLVTTVIVGGISVIYVCAWLSFRFFESPFLRIKGKFHD